MSVFRPGQSAIQSAAAQRRSSGGISLLDYARLESANAGDHALIYQLLLAVYQGPSREEFAASLDDPYYEPLDRLLLKHGDQVVSHVQLTKRTLCFGEVHLPIAELQWLATLPEYRGAGHAHHLLEAADQQMRDDGAVVAGLNTTDPELFTRLGWIEAGRRQYLRMRVGDLLAHITEPEERSGAGRRAISTRMWRQVELRGLMRIYEQNTAASYGPLVRSEDYWRWLASRNAHDQIIVAIEGDDRLEFGELAPKLVGYAVMKGKQVVELMTDGDSRVAKQLLLRAAREAIERNLDTLEARAVPGSPLANHLVAAGARMTASNPTRPEVLMLKLLDAEEFVRRIYPTLHDRAKAADIARPSKIAFCVDDRPFRLVLTRRSSRLETPGSLGRVDVTCTWAQFSQLLLGHTPTGNAATEKSLHCRNKSVLRLLEKLLPPQLHWRPQLDELSA